MKYLVMECHLSYAVVLDEEGRFLRVANRHYKVGQMVTNIIEMQIPQERTDTGRKKRKNWIYSLAAVAACLILVAVSMLRMGQTIYASVYMAINPEVRIDVNGNDVVIGLEGINGDGRDLIEDYLYQKKDLNVVMSELVDRAIGMGYLHEGGQISLTLDSGDGDWISAHGSSLEASLNEHLTEKMNVTIEITNRSSSGQQIIIPIEPDRNDQDNPDQEETSETASEYETDEVLDTGDDTDNPDTGDEQNNSVRPEPPEDESQTSEEPDRDPWLPGNDGDEEGASEGSRDENDDSFNSDVTGDDGGENNGRDDDGTDDDNRDDDDADNDDGNDDNGDDDNGDDDGGTDDGDRNDGADDDRNDDDADDDDDRNDDNGDGDGDTDDDDDADDDDDTDDDDDMDDDDDTDDD